MPAKDHQQVHIADGEVDGVVFLAEEAADHDGTHGGRAAIAQTGDDKADRHQREAVEEQSGHKDQHAGQTYYIDGGHGQLPAQLVKQPAEEDAAQAVADGDEAHHKGDNPRVHAGTHLGCKGLGLRDDGQTDAADEDGPQEKAPEAGGADHAGGGDIRPADILTALGGGGGGRQPEEQGTHADDHSHHNAHNQEGLPPGARLSGGYGVKEGAQHHAAGAEPHQQHAGDKSLAVGEPLGHGAHHRVVGKAGGCAAQHAVAHIEHGQGAGPGDQEKAHQEQRRGEKDIGAHGDTLGQVACGEAAQAEEGHTDGESEGQLCRAPLGEIRPDGGGKHAPAVDKSGEEKHHKAYRGVEPPHGAGNRFCLHHRSSTFVKVRACS